MQVIFMIWVLLLFGTLYPTAEMVNSDVSFLTHPNMQFFRSEEQNYLYVCSHFRFIRNWHFVRTDGTFRIFEHFLDFLVKIFPEEFASVGV